LQTENPDNAGLDGQNPDFRTIILAGERKGGNALSRAFKLSASVMVQVAGKPSLERVMDAINKSRYAEGGIICGPAIDVLESCKELQVLLQQPGYQWLAPATGPAASAFSALQTLDHFPTLLTAGDHALLSADIIDKFCALAQSHSDDSGFDIIIGLVPYALVQAAWPESKRTVLKFSNGHYCGSNLFAILNPDGAKALSFWRQAEADRKHPWRIARRLGPIALLRYLFRRVTVEDALSGLSKAAGCRIGHVRLDIARAAVDVDSVADQKLAEEILLSEKPG